MNKNELKRVVLYIRVSTDMQVENFSISEQRQRLIDYCKAMGWLIVEIYIDAGYSGKDIERPAMQRMIESAKNKEFDIILVYKLDRLSRSQKDTLFLIEDIFLPNSIDFVSVQENFDTGSPFGLAMVGILSVFAQLERSQIAERMSMGRIGRAKEGLWHGGGFDPIGYDYIDGKLVINEIEAKQVKMIFSMYAAGLSIAKISRKMDGYSTKHGDWSHPGTISSTLDNPLYMGIVHFKGAITPDSHTAIIDDDTFQRVRKLRENIGQISRQDSQHLLTGLIYCSRCNARYFAKRQPNGLYSYCCHSRAKSSKKMIKDPTCKNDNWRKNLLEIAVKEELLFLYNNPSVLIERYKKRHDQSEPFRGAQTDKAIEKINNQIDDLVKLYHKENAPIGEIAGQIRGLHEEKTKLLNTTIGNDSRDFKIGEFKLLLKDIPAILNDDKKCRDLLMKLGLKIMLDGRNISFTW